MPETKNNISPEEVWQSLSQQEKKVCIVFAVSDWGTGVEKEYLEFMEVEDKEIDELVKREILEKKPTWKIFQELAEQLEDEATKIKNRDFSIKLSDNERKILQDHSRYVSVAKRKSEELRYRLINQEFHNYIDKMHREK